MRSEGDSLKLRDIMTTQGLTTSAERPVAEATSMMVKARVGSAAASGSDLTKSPVSEWMTRNPITATPDTTIGEAADVMLANGFRHLPVVEGRELKGVVSIRDVLASGIRSRSNPE